MADTGARPEGSLESWAPLSGDARTLRCGGLAEQGRTRSITPTVSHLFLLSPTALPPAFQTLRLLAPPPPQTCSSCFTWAASPIPALYFFPHFLDIYHIGPQMRLAKRRNTNGVHRRTTTRKLGCIKHEKVRAGMFSGSHTHTRVSVHGNTHTDSAPQSG